MDKNVKNFIARRKIAYIYLMHRMFEGSPALMLKTMRITGVKVEDIEEWDSEYKEAVYKTIQEEDANGVALKDPNEDVPSIKAIKEKILRRVNTIIDEATDPARLATAYKFLSEFEASDDKKEKSVLDAISESIKPLAPKQKEKPVMLVDRMRKESGRINGKEDKADREENDEEE